MKKFIFILVLLFAGFSLTAQTCKIVGTKVVVVNRTKKPTYKDSGLTFTIKGKSYPVYISKRGKYFIIRTSEKSGKKYRKYLTIVTD